MKTSRAKRLRCFLAERDGLTCYWCGRKLQMTKYKASHGRLPPDFATLDHLVRVIDGGKLNRKNIVLACKKCNSSRHHKPLFAAHTTEKNDEFLKRIKTKALESWIGFIVTILVLIGALIGTILYVVH